MYNYIYIHICNYIYNIIEGSLKSNLRQYGKIKIRDGKSQRKEEKKKKEQGRERVRRQKMQVLEKVAKSLNNVFFQ